MRWRLAAVLAAATASLAGTASAATFTIAPGDWSLPGADRPNAAGQIVQPLAISTPPERPAVLSYDQLLVLWKQAGEAYGIPWQVLASINQIESDFGRGMGPSSAGAVGWMQFLPSTWQSWGVDANGDGVADPWNPTDAVFAAARYLAASGAHADMRQAVYAYNHSTAYVDAVMAGAARFAADPLAAAFGFSLGQSGPTLDDLERELEQARQRVAQGSSEVTALEQELEQTGWELDAAEQAAGDPALSDVAFHQAQEAVAAREAAKEGRTAEFDAARQALADAQAEVARLEQDVALARADAGQGSLDGLLPQPPTEAAGKVIETALGQLGVPYRWGGNHGYSLEQMVTLDPVIENGFDCSSLLAWSYAKGAGIYIGDYTGTQWEYGASAPGATRGPGPAQGGADPPGGYLPGDLVFFNDTDHVALYLGNDLFVHAPHTGDVVRVARLSDYGPVWGWVRYAQVSGVGEAPAGGERVFSVVEIDRS